MWSELPSTSCDPRKRLALHSGRATVFCMPRPAATSQPARFVCSTPESCRNYCTRNIVGPIELIAHAAHSVDRAQDAAQLRVQTQKVGRPFPDIPLCGQF